MTSEEYDRAWPNYCRSCDGWGYAWKDFDPSLAGVGLGSGFYRDMEICANCLEKGVCPRCFRSLYTRLQLFFIRVHDCVTRTKYLDFLSNYLKDYLDFLLCGYCGFNFENNEHGTSGRPPVIEDYNEWDEKEERQ